VSATLVASVARLAVKVQPQLPEQPLVTLDREDGRYNST